MSKSAIIGRNSMFSILGQATFLISNFVLFYLLINQFEQVEFGAWALYITLISISDTLRQGLIQNGLTKFLIENPDQKASLVSSGLIMNLGTIAIVSVALSIAAPLIAKVWHSDLLVDMLPLSFQSLLGLGLLQFLNTLNTAKEDFRAYLINNALYALAFLSGVTILMIMNALTLSSIIMLQMLAVIPSIIFSVAKKSFPIGLPKLHWIRQLFQFGRYAAGTNLLSLLFAKADIIFIGYYLNPAAVAIYHFATKIINYADLPINALSQVLYPKIVKAFKAEGINASKHLYGSLVFKLLAVCVPLSIVLFLFKDVIVYLLSSNSYEASIPVISILLLACIAKPWGRVFGLTLDAAGMPNVNFQMLAFSLIINVGMNALLIPLIGISGAAWATTLSIVITVIIGQLRIGKILNIKHREVFNQQVKAFRKAFQSLKPQVSWI